MRRLNVEGGQGTAPRSLTQERKRRQPYSDCFFGILIVPNRARKIEMPSSASGAMTAGGRRPCVILPRQNQNSSGNNYHSNKCPCMGLHIMKTGRSVIGPCFARQGRIRYLNKCDIPGLMLPPVDPPALRGYPITNMAMTALAMTTVQSHPSTLRRRCTTKLPMMSVRAAINIMTAIIGTEIMPFTTALQ